MKIKKKNAKRNRTVNEMPVKNKPNYRGDLYRDFIKFNGRRIAVTAKTEKELREKLLPEEEKEKSRHWLSSHGFNAERK